MEDGLVPFFLPFLLSFLLNPSPKAFGEEEIDELKMYLPWNHGRSDSLQEVKNRRMIHDDGNRQVIEMEQVLSFFSSEIRVEQNRGQHTVRVLPFSFFFFFFFFFFLMAIIFLYILKNPGFAFTT
jgi:hypothetical protein